MMALAAALLIFMLIAILFGAVQLVISLIIIAIIYLCIMEVIDSVQTWWKNLNQ